MTWLAWLVAAALLAANVVLTVALLEQRRRYRALKWADETRRKAAVKLAEQRAKQLFEEKLNLRVVPHSFARRDGGEAS